MIYNVKRLHIYQKRIHTTAAGQLQHTRPAGRHYTPQSCQSVTVGSDLTHYPLYPLSAPI